MLDERLPAFEGQERLIDMVLGLLSWGERLARLALVPRADAGRCVDGPAVDFLLGVISVRRTLRAVLTAHDRADATAPPSAPHPKARSRILR